MPQPEAGQFKLRPFSLRRNSIHGNLAMLALLVVTVLIPVYGHHSINKIREALPNALTEPGLPGTPPTSGAAAGGRSTSTSPNC